MACLQPAHQWHKAEQQDFREAARVKEACRAAEKHLDRALALQLAEGVSKNALGIGTVSDCYRAYVHAPDLEDGLAQSCRPDSCSAAWLVATIIMPASHWWVGCGVWLMLPLLMCRLMI